MLAPIDVQVYSVLVVDDLEANRYSLEKMLEPTGANVFTAASAEEGLSFLLNHHVDVILLDYSMPGMNGVEMAEMIQMQFKEPPPIIFVTAHGRNVTGLEKLCYEQGAFDFVEKPVKEDILIAKLNVLFNIAEQKGQLQELARTDSLTGLKNRLAFEDAVEQNLALAKRRDQMFAVMCIDMDDFKQVNDTHGHAAGDEILKSFARRLQGSIRTSDVAARIGGDEFIVLITNIESLFDAKEVTNKILAACKPAVKFQDALLRVKLSIGIAVFPEHGVTSKALIKAADAALYQTKESGKGGVSIYEPIASECDDSTISALKVTYQPVYDSERNQVLGGEALTQLPDIGVNVHDAIVQFRRTGKSDLFEKAICNKIKNDISKICDIKGGENWSLFINHSVLDSMKGSYISELIVLKDELNQNNIELILDIADWSKAIEKHHLVDSIRHIERCGVSICLQGVGDTVIPCDLIEKVKIKYLKISEKIVRKIVDEPRAQAIVQSIGLIAKSQGAQMIAVGVESESQKEKLGELGCHLYQGFIFQKAIPIEDFRKLKQR